MKHIYEIKVGKQVPDLVSETYLFILKALTPGVDTEENRFFY